MSEYGLAGLCNVHDGGTFLYGYGCVPCFSVCWLQAHAVSQATMSEEKDGAGMLIPFLIVLGLGCVGGAINRYWIRASYQVPQAIVTDLCAWALCPVCAALQDDAFVRDEARLSKH